jgi:hypothetical protein
MRLGTKPRGAPPTNQPRETTKMDIQNLPIQALQETPQQRLEPVTRDQLFEEARELGERFTPVSCHPADLVADADEMLEVKSDLPDLVARKYRVSEGLFTRIELLRNEVAALLAEHDRLQVLSKQQTESAEAARLELLEIRRQLARLGKAAGLTASLFSLETKKSTRLNVVMMKVSEVLANVAAVRSLLPDPDRVEKLESRARALIEAHRAQRVGARLMGVERTGQTATRDQLLRLLFDALSHLSAQGLAAYPNDARREVHYRLDHVYGRRASVVGDAGAGGESGVPGAAGPSGDDNED